MSSSDNKSADLGTGPWRSARQLLVVLGDQLDGQARLWEEASSDDDVVWMAEVAEEAEHVVNHKHRVALFLSAMRHFALYLGERDWRVRYIKVDDRRNEGTLAAELGRAIDTLGPERVRVTQPGDLRVQAALEQVCKDRDVPFEVVPDDSFTCSPEAFRSWAEGRKNLTMEYFYRERRRALDVLMDGDEPEGGRWNFDQNNREVFSEAPDIRRPYRPRPDEVTREVFETVQRLWPDTPGSLDTFHWPVTRREALRALDDFIEHRLERFGPYEDAMWTGEAVLFHSRLSAAINLGLLRPMECVEKAVAAYHAGDAPINSVEGFVRQLIGWREFIRGVYHLEGKGYTDRNGLRHQGNLPEFYWTGDTDMNCLSHCLGEVVEHGWGHHIPRLMVIGNFALIAGVHPRKMHDWFLGMYVDAVDWVTAPNVIGMSQHADGGIVGTKPYAGSGKYISRMSNYCKSCRYDVGQRVGENACPFNVFYWDFLIRHRKRFASNHRMAMMLKNVDRMKGADRKEIPRCADKLRDRFGVSG